LFKQLKDGEQPTFMDSVKEAVASLKEIGGQIWDGGKPLFDHGRTEAAALFAGHAHVMYMHGQQGVAQGQDQVQSPELTQQKEMEGREMEGREMEARGRPRRHRRVPVNRLSFRPIGPSGAARTSKALTGRRVAIAASTGG
jgi:hypothetical protein